MRKQRHREVKSLVQGHTASERQNQDLSGGGAGSLCRCVPLNVFTARASLGRTLCISLAVYLSPALSIEPTTVRGLNYTEEGRRYLSPHCADSQTCASFRSAVFDLGLSPATSACHILCWPPFHRTASPKLTGMSPLPASWTRCHAECLFGHPLHHQGGGRRLTPELPESGRKDETCP